MQVSAIFVKHVKNVNIYGGSLQNQSHTLI